MKLIIEIGRVKRAEGLKGKTRNAAKGNLRKSDFPGLLLGTLVPFVLGR